MIYQNNYEETPWHNDTEPSINDENLLHIEHELKKHDNALAEVAITKADESDVLEMVTDIDYNDTTGIITIHKKNGAVITIDLPIEMTPADFQLSPDGILTLITEDGHRFNADLRRIIKQITFKENSTFYFTATNKTEMVTTNYPNDATEINIGGKIGTFGFNVNGTMPSRVMVTTYYSDDTSQSQHVSVADGEYGFVSLKPIDRITLSRSGDATTSGIDFNAQEVIGQEVEINIKAGSITADKLQPNYLADITLQANRANTAAGNAKASETNARTSAETAQHWAQDVAGSLQAQIEATNDMVFSRHIGTPLGTSFGETLAFSNGDVIYADLYFPSTDIERELHNEVQRLNADISALMAEIRLLKTVTQEQLIAIKED